ncbi:MAG: iron-containing alcohol dehydrogenase, partial [bacterium]|nr:iron-containing alcohol dehydrogenase [bacterium]
MDDRQTRAQALLDEFKGADSVYGLNCFDQLGGLASALGSRVSVVTSGVGKEWGTHVHDATRSALDAGGVTFAGEPIAGPLPNAPFEDVYRIADALAAQEPEVAVAVGGGSTIDCTKVAIAHWVLRDRFPDLRDYFGMGQVSRLLAETGRTIPPIVA